MGKPGAGKKWLDAYSIILSNAADIIILPDADKTGEEYRDCVAASLAKVGARVRILDLPGLGPKGDVVDWAAAGGTAEMLKDLVETDARPWVRSNDHNAEDGAPVFVSRGPTIYMAAGQLERLVNETEAAVIAAERGLYQRGGQIVRIGEAQLLGADEKPTTSLVIQEQDEHTLVEDASASAIFMKYDERSEDWRVANPTSLIIRAWQGRATRLRLPLLSGVISTPLILKSGRIIERPGYDEGTGFYFEPGGTIFPPVPTAPTKDDALVALEVP